VQVIVRNGKIIASAWPRKRGRNKLVWTRNNSVRMDTIQIGIKYMPTEERSLLEEGLATFLSNHKGLRGTAAIRARDWLTQLFSGRFAALYDELGEDRRPQASESDASDFIDWIEARIGAMMIRTTTGWLSSSQTAPGQVLHITAGIPVFDDAAPPSMPDAANAMGGLLL
jgi:hypothetical protein